MRLAPRPLPMLRLAALRGAALALLLTLPLAGCVVNPSGGSGSPPATNTPATDASGKPLIEQPAGAPALSKAPVAAPGADMPGEVDDSCSTDADCAVKNIGNCCGYYPACVNAASPTFPEQVQAECAKHDRMSVCGFRDIAGCQCVDGRCAALHVGEGPVR